MSDQHAKIARENGCAASTDGGPDAASPAATALAEAEERRRRQAMRDQARPREIGGRKGPEPTRYGDWEKGGIASDF
jgi:hypothetical protein